MEKRCEFDFDEVENYTEEKKGNWKKNILFTDILQKYSIITTYIVLIIQQHYLNPRYLRTPCNILLFKNHMLDWLPL